MNNEEKILQMLINLTEKVTKLEQGQNELQQDVTKIEKRVTKTDLTIENTIIPSIQILKEGQLTIQNQIKKLSVIDAMQDDIATLKTAVKFLSQELDKLQKAM